MVVTELEHHSNFVPWQYIAKRTGADFRMIPLDDEGRNADLDLNLATRRALIELLDWLTSERSLGREAAYVLMSVAAELRISEVVDAPNALVSAALPLDVFEEA